MSNGRDKWEGRVEAQLETIQDSQKEIKGMIEQIHVSLHDCNERHVLRCNLIEKDIEKTSKDLATLEVRSGFLGTIAGFLGGLGAGLLSFFAKFR